jgi:DNA-binding NtrC family response regulator
VAGDHRRLDPPPPHRRQPGDTSRQQRWLGDVGPHQDRLVPSRAYPGQVEAEHLELVLASVNGNKTRAAEILGLDRKTLREKLRRHSPPGT